MVALCAASVGAMVGVARGTAYHTTCVPHGFVAGTNPSDSSWFARVSAGCGSSARYCYIYASGVQQGGSGAFDSTTTCSSWSRDFGGSLNECTGAAGTNNPGIFSFHLHESDSC